jgi:hypothetical protein
MKLDDLPAKYRAQAMSQINHRATICAPKPERNGAETLYAGVQIPRMDAPVHIVFTIHKTGSSWDVDNREIKGVLDAITKSGILEDDKVGVVEEITKRGKRVKSKAEEKTVIEITSVEIIPKETK